MALSIMLLGQLLVGSIVAFVLYRIRQVFSDPLRSIPGPPLARFTRYWYTRALKRGDFERQNIELHRKHGPIVRVAPNMYSFQDLSAVATIYGTSNIFPKSRWYFTFQQPDQPNIFSTHSNHIAAHLRRAYKPAFDALHTYEHAVDNCVEIMAQKLTELIQKGDADKLDIGWWLTCFAFDVNGEIAFAKRFGHLDEGKDIGNIAGALSERLDYCTHIGVYPSLHPWLWLGISLLTAVMKQIDYTYVFTLQCIDEHRERQKTLKPEEKTAKPKDMLTRLYELHEKDPEAFTSNDVLIGAYTNLVAGADTTWVTLGSIMNYLHRNPKPLTKLRNEIDTFASEGKISDPLTWEEAKKMPYLQACLREGMRMHAATGLPLWRTVPKGGAEICGKFFPEGTTIGVNTWVMHYSDAFSPDPDTFRPDRWLESDKEQLVQMNKAFLAFGMGPRNCAGQHIAQMEMSKLIPLLVRRFEFELQGEWMSFNHWLVGYKGLKAKVRQRVTA